MFDVNDRPANSVVLDRARPISPMQDLKPQGDGSINVADGQMPGANRDPKRTHAQLMDCLDDEGERQAEERYQMAIDEDYNDHQHWRPEDAAVLQERGQAPLVFNEGRQTIEWISGTEKRMRKDFKVLPREPDDEQGAEVKTQLLKYTDDVNMTQYHRSAAFKQMATAGLSWLEEGVNPDPAEDIIYSGKEDWRNVLRDSRGRDIMLRDWRYQFRKKRLDLDYAQALLSGIAPDRAALLKGQAYQQTEEPEDADGPWYLGQKLTSASDIGNTWRKATTFDERAAYMQSNGYYDAGRRLSVDIIESYYRVPEACKVFVGGMLDGKIVNPMDPRHKYAIQREGAQTRDAVKMRMRVMLCTRDSYIWDGESPFSHGQFILIPLIAYRRARDGMIYGVWRGMRDLSDDTNKRRAKALWALSANQVITDEKNITEEQDLDMVRHEASRVDGVLTKKQGAELTIRENTHDIQGNLQMAAENTAIMRNIGGVTNENLGLNTQAQSGKAIVAKQDQGSLTTSDLFDNYQLAIKLQGKIRLSHVEQFYTQRKAIRIVGRGKPFEWLVLNEFDPETGEYKNDVTQNEADFEVDTQDYRSSLRMAALEQMFALLGQVATFAPQVVLSVLDLVVDSADLPNKQEWVTRIRAINGQRDPGKAPTPEEMAQDQVKQKKMAEAEAMQELLAEAQLDLTRATAKEKNAGADMKLIEKAVKTMGGMLQALEGAIMVTNAPHIIPAADALAGAAGLPDAEAPPTVPALAASRQPPQLPAPEQQLGPDGAPLVEPAPMVDASAAPDGATTPAISG